MIEFRWLNKSMPRPRGIDDGMLLPRPPDTIKIPVLQYRETPRGTFLPLYVEPQWVDVPFVEDT